MSTQDAIAHGDRGRTASAIPRRVGFFPSRGRKSVLHAKSLHTWTAWRFVLLWIDRLGEKRVEGVSGTARIDDAGKTGDGSCLKLTDNFPFKVDCELRDYTVQLPVKLGLSKEDTAHVRGSSPHDLMVSHRRLSGLQLVVHCNGKNTEIGGCQAPSTLWQKQ